MGFLSMGFRIGSESKKGKSRSCRPHRKGACNDGQQPAKNEGPSSDRWVARRSLVFVGLRPLGGRPDGYRLAADADGEAVMPPPVEPAVPPAVLPVLPVLPVPAPVVPPAPAPSPALLHAERASAAVSAHAREEI